MNRKTAKTIAKIITNDQLQFMFNNAKNCIKDWTQVSSVNKTITKGTTWNILASNFDVNQDYHILTKINMIREFGEYLPIKLIPHKKESIFHKPPIHQDPIFLK